MSFTATSVDLGVRNVHLISGEDIIGHVFQTPDGLRVENPVTPLVGQDPKSGAFRVSLMPLRPYLQEAKEVTIPEGHVIYSVPVGEQMDATYRRMHSDIVVASPSNLQQLLAQK